MSQAMIAARKSLLPHLPVIATIPAICVFIIHRWQKDVRVSFH